MKSLQFATIHKIIDNANNLDELENIVKLTQMRIDKIKRMERIELYTKTLNTTNIKKVNIINSIIDVHKKIIDTCYYDGECLIIKFNTTTLNLYINLIETYKKYKIKGYHIIFGNYYEIFYKDTDIENLSFLSIEKASCTCTCTCTSYTTCLCINIGDVTNIINNIPSKLFNQILLKLGFPINNDNIEQIKLILKQFLDESNNLKRYRHPKKVKIIFQKNL